MSAPKISVLMSVYNGAPYLREAIESIRNQTFESFEFLIVDDASTEVATPQILQEYAFSDKRIKIITNEENLGLTKSLNRGLVESQGEYIARMDADDISHPERLRKQVSYMEQHPAVGLLGTRSYIIDRKGKIMGARIFPLYDQEIKRALVRYNPFIHASVMMRRTAIDSVGGYDENIKRSQDYELWWRLAKEWKLANLPELLVKKRFTQNAISTRNEREQIVSRLKVRHHYLRERHYAVWQYVFFVKPLLMLLLPSPIRVFLRNLLLKMRWHRMKKDENFLSYH